jgi:ketosteroid isomerase-like protein
MPRASTQIPLIVGLVATPVFASEPAAVVDSFHAALQSGDTRAIPSLLTPDALVFEGGHVERSAAEYMAGHLAGDAAHAARTVTRYGARRCMIVAEQAVIATETISSARDGSDPRVGTETMVLTRSGAGWRIGHIHWSSRKIAAGKQVPTGTANPPACA